MNFNKFFRSSAEEGAGWFFPGTSSAVCMHEPQPAYQYVSHCLPISRKSLTDSYLPRQECPGPLAELRSNAELWRKRTEVFIQNLSCKGFRKFTVIEDRIRARSVACLPVLLGSLVMGASSDNFSLSNKSQAADDFSFSVDFEFKSPVAMFIYDSARYQIDPSSGGADYAKLMPSGGHNVHIRQTPDDRPQPFTVTLFHQLKCLEVYHKEYNTDPPIPLSPRLVHCLNYFRQTILCNLDLKLESVRTTLAQSQRGYETVCRDWTLVYEEAEWNYEAYQRWKKGNGWEGA